MTHELTYQQASFLWTCDMTRLCQVGGALSQSQEGLVWKVLE